MNTLKFFKLIILTFSLGIPIYIFLWLLLYAQLSTSISLNSKVTISSSSALNIFYVGIPIQLQLQINGPPWPTVYALVEWDEFSSTNYSIYSLYTVTSPVATFSHTYLSDGVRKIKIILSDSPISVLNTNPGMPLSYYAIDSDLEPSKPFSFIFSVLKKPTLCYDYSANVTFLKHLEDLKFEARVAFQLVDPTNTLKSSDVTRLFYTLGHNPSLILRNSTFSLALDSNFSSSLNLWEVNIPSNRLQSVQELMLDIIPDSLSIFQCAVNPLTLSVHPPSYDYSNWGITPLTHVSTSLASTSDRLRLIQNPCITSQMVIFPSPSAQNSQFLYTFDAFKTYFVFSNSDFCNNFLSSTTNCTSFLIHDIHFFDDNFLLLHTSEGLFSSSSLFSSFSKIITGYSLINSGSSMMFTQRNCFSKSIGLKNSAFLVYSTWSSSSNTFGTWKSVGTPSTSMVILDSYYSSFSNSWKILVQNTQNGLISYSILDEQWNVFYMFPSNAIIKGLALTKNSIYAFGSHLFHTIQDGHNKYWHLDYTLPMNSGQLSTSPYGTSFISLVTSLVGEQLVLITDKGMVFYGRLASKSLIFLPHLLQWNTSITFSPILFNYFFDCAGDLYFGSLIYDTSHSQMDYSKISVPVYSLLNSQDMLDTRSNSTYMGYIPTGIRKVHLKALSLTGNTLPNTFGVHDLETALKNENGSGELVVQAVNQEGTQLELEVRTEWDPYFSAMDSLTIITLSQSSELSVSFSNNSVINVSIIGMTLVVNHVHSIFVKSILNTTTITGLLLTKLSLSDSWINAFVSFYDFRSFQFPPLSISDTITLTSNSALNPGSNVSLQTSFVLNPILHSNMFAQFTTASGKSLVRIISIDSSFIATALVINAQSDLFPSSTISVSNLSLFPAFYMSPDLLKPVCMPFFFFRFLFSFFSFICGFF
ncbi:hypothetical protein HMI54_012843 [Coelomomyces lativittatus]|nr:hypothetical protein HMI54_012843 [Coelomomyces lativittatus]